MAKHKIRNAIKRHKVASVIVAVPLIVILLVILLFAGLFVKSEVFDPVYYPYQEKRFGMRRNAHNFDSVYVGASSDSPDVSVTILCEDGRNCGSFRGVRKAESDWEKNPTATVGSEGNYTVVVKNNTGHWIRANVDYWDNACSPLGC